MMRPTNVFVRHRYGNRTKCNYAIISFSKRLIVAVVMIAAMIMAYQQVLAQDAQGVSRSDKDRLFSAAQRYNRLQADSINNCNELIDLAVEKLQGMLSVVTNERDLLKKQIDDAEKVKGSEKEGSKPNES